MYHIVRSFVAPLAPPHFSTLSCKWYDFQKKLIVAFCNFANTPENNIYSDFSFLVVSLCRDVLVENLKEVN
jgi:hypothetical protein